MTFWEIVKIQLMASGVVSTTSSPHFLHITLLLPEGLTEQSESIDSRLPCPLDSLTILLFEPLLMDRLQVQAIQFPERFFGYKLAAALHSKKIDFYFCVYVHVSVCEYMPCVCTRVYVSVEGQRGHQIPWTWS